ncbi:beta-glucuronosyltransferase GlcAT14A-like isoform X2 [Primulina huaijiensis]|uniref:beta-glucuronosyltransferase GlcAT14A-like isoform X2 n=1 Tax=Primulina huaijiensis TaxID=1492673 RepID=UPI003CC6E3FA
MGAERKWLFSLFSAAFVSFLMFLSFISGFSSTNYNDFSSHKPFDSAVLRGPGHPPAFAYYIFGGRGDGERIFRLLLAVYHPRNRYLLHISADGGDEERARLAALVKSVPAVRAFENVDVFGKPDPNTLMGSTNIAAILRAAAVLLKMDEGWDWFLTLSAMDYPLVTQDDLSHVFSSVKRDLNFIDHTSDLGWKEGQRIEPIVVDPGIYLARRTQIFHATEKRPMPDAFKVFTGSPWVVLSRSFLKFCVFGWDNLPRTILIQFEKDQPVLDMIDRKILMRGRNRVTPGAWCKGRQSWLMDPCSQWGNVNVVKPGPQVKIFEESINKLISDWNSELGTCT